MKRSVEKPDLKIIYMRKIINTLAAISILFFLHSCNNTQGTKTGSKGITEKFIEDTIFSLKEVQEKNLLIDSISNHKSGISLIIEKPTPEEPNYYIRAGYNGFERFETYYHFYFDSATNNIFIDDFAFGKRVNLNVWRNQKPDSVYLKLGTELLNSENLNGLKIGLDEAKTTDLIGNPEETSKISKWGSDGLNHQTWTYKTKGIELDICWDKVTKKEIYRITITKPCNYKTFRKIGIGSTKEQVRGAYLTEINPTDDNETTIVAGSVFGGIIFDFENNIVNRIFIGASAE